MLIPILIWLFIGTFFIGFLDSKFTGSPVKQLAVILLGPLTLGAILGAAVGDALGIE